MSLSEPEDRDLERRKEELSKKERELRLRELELEIERREPPLHQTQKHQSNKKTVSLAKKLVRYGKFIGFVVFGVALVKVGVIIGVWLTNIVFLSIFGFVGYKLFIDRQD